MENENNLKNKLFDSFINKTIIMSSRSYFKKQMNIIDKERIIIDDKDYSAILENYISTNGSNSDIECIESSLQFNNIIKSLSALEQSVIFLLFKEELTQSEAAEILTIYSKTISKIKIRAIEKLKETLKGEFDDEK